MGFLEFKILKDQVSVFKKKENLLLGFVYFRKDWKCYVWNQEQNTDMSESCMQEVWDFVRRNLKHE